MRFQITPEFLASQGLSLSFPKRFWAKVDKNGPLPDPVKYPDVKGRCWVWTGVLDRHGYGILDFRIRKRNTRVGPTAVSHRLAFELKFGIIPKRLRVLHHCDNPPCCRPSHLFSGTPKDNTDDMMKKGRNKFIPHLGESNGSAKLTEKQVIRIRKIYSTGKIFQRPLAKKFGVSQRAVCAIVRRILWKHI